MRVSGLWIPERFWEDFLKPTVWIPTELRGMTKRQTRVYKALIRCFDKNALSGLISKTACCAHGEMPLWRYFWPEGFDRDTLNACEHDADLVETVLLMMAAAREGFLLKPKRVEVEFDDERCQESKRARFCQGFLLARRGGLAIWVSRPEETFTLFSKPRCKGMRRGPGEIASAVTGVDLHILPTGAVCCFSLYGARGRLEDIERALMKSARRAAALTRRKRSVKAIARDASLSTARVYQLRKARGLAGPKAIEMKRRRARVSELRAAGFSQHEIAKRLRVTHRQVRAVWEEQE